MGDGVRVRCAKAADCDQLFGLIGGLADYENLSDQVSGSSEKLREHLFGEPRYAHALIGEYDGEAVGYALFFYSYSTFLTRPGIYLEDLFVVPEMRGRGVGRALLARVATLAHQGGCGRLEWSVLDWNESALGFYRAMGARPVEGWTTYRLTGTALDRLASQGEET